jgi:hypothetical protein
VPGLILASTSDNAPGGAVLTFAFPIVLFAVIAVILYLLFSRPHRRVPPRQVALATASGAPSAEASHAAAVAAGLPTASGGGSTESAAEPAGAKLETATAPDPGGTTTGSVSGEAGESAKDGEAETGKTEGTEASE